MAPASSASFIAAGIARKRRKIFETFRSFFATSPATAKTLDELRITGSYLFQIQVRRKVIIRIEGDRYYLDEARLQEVDRLRHKLVVIPIIALVVSLLVLIGALVLNK